MKPTRRSLVLGALAAPLAATARADTWPSGTIKIIVPFPPGGSVDPIARMAQPGLQQKLNANIVIENRPGSGTVIATNFIAKSQPDGYTIMMTVSSLAINATAAPTRRRTIKCAYACRRRTADCCSPCSRTATPAWSRSR